MINFYVIILYVREAQRKTQPKNYKSYGEEKNCVKGILFSTFLFSLLRVKTIIVSDRQSIPGTGRLKEIPSKS